MRNSSMGPTRGIDLKTHQTMNERSCPVSMHDNITLWTFFKISIFFLLSTFIMISRQTNLLHSHFLVSMFKKLHVSF